MVPKTIFFLFEAADPVPGFLLFRVYESLIFFHRFLVSSTTKFIKLISESFILYLLYRLYRYYFIYQVFQFFVLFNSWFYDFKKANYDQFNFAIASYDWYIMYKLNDFNAALDIFNEVSSVRRYSN